MTIYNYGIRFSMVEDGIKGPKRTYLIKDISSNINKLQLNDIVVIDDEEYSNRNNELNQCIIVSDILYKIFTNYDCRDKSNYYFRNCNSIRMCKTFDEIRCYGEKHFGKKLFRIFIIESGLTNYHKKNLLDTKWYAAYIILKKWKVAKYNPNTILCQNIISKKMNKLLNENK